VILSVFLAGITKETPMALTQSALSDLLDDIRAGGSVDVMREATALVLLAFIEAEAAQAIGVARYERTDERITHRNGNRSRCALHQGR
jgi:putative transposase